MSESTEHEYVIAGGRTGTERLSILSSILRPSTLALLKRAGVRAGDHVVDLGCGGGDVALDIADIVGSAGSVEAYDFDAAAIEIARQKAVQHDVTNLQFFEADLEEWSAPRTYDIAYLRFILSHLVAPATLLRRVRNALRPGGRVVIKDTQFAGHFSSPESPAFKRYCSWYTSALAGRGGDADIGPSIYTMLMEAGFRVEDVRIVQPVQRATDEHNMAVETMKRIESSLVPRFASKEAYDETLFELKQFTSEPSTLTTLPRIFEYIATPILV